MFLLLLVSIFIIAELKAAAAIMSTQAEPPKMYQKRIPTKSDSGPAIIKPIGIMAVAQAPRREKTRPCISGRIDD